MATMCVRVFYRYRLNILPPYNHNAFRYEIIGILSYLCVTLLSTREVRAGSTVRIGSRLPNNKSLKRYNFRDPVDSRCADSVWESKSRSCEYYIVNL